MLAFVINAYAETASFRVPETHTFHQTLPMPPVTTLTGLIGAALDLSFEDAMAYRERGGVHFGLKASFTGEMKDLWKYDKIKSDEVIKDVLVREFLVDYTLDLIVASEKEETLKEIRAGFEAPRYALTLGNSDSLMKIIKIRPIVEARDCRETSFQDTVLKLDNTQNFDYESDIDLKNTPITYKVRAPQIFLLPTAFTYSEGQRRVSKREHFVFVGSPIRLKVPIPAYRVGDLDDLTVALL